MILHTQPNKKWTPLDFLLIEAYEIMKSEICQRCGLPVWVCHNDLDECGVEFEVDDDTCFATRELEIDARDNKSEDGAADGSAKVPRPYSRIQAMDWGMREAYYRAEQEKAKLKGS